MSDGLIFVFGLIALLVAVGPLVIAAISEVREEDERK